MTAPKLSWDTSNLCYYVIPANAGIQKIGLMDSGFRQNDGITSGIFEAIF